MSAKKIIVGPFVPTLVESGECYAVIREECTDKLLWNGRPFNNERAAMRRAAGRQMERIALSPRPLLTASGN